MHTVPRETSYQLLCDILHRMENDIICVGEVLPDFSFNEESEYHLTREDAVVMLHNLHNDMEVALTRLANLAKGLNYDNSMPTPDWVRYNLEGS